MRRKLEKGQGLVETLIAVAVAVIVVTALISLAVFALRNSRQAAYTAQATQLAQSQLDMTRAYRDSHSWSDFAVTMRGACTSAQGAKVCYFPPGATTYSVGAGTSGVFQYGFSLVCTGSVACDATGGTVRAQASVSWTIGGRPQNVYSVTDFTNWRGK